MTHNILFIGSSGSGKSSIINSFFDEDVADVGEDDVSCTPSTITYFKDNYVFYDTPGFFESGVSNQNMMSCVNSNLKNIIDKVQGVYFDKVILVIDASVAKFFDDYKMLLVYLKTVLGDNFTNNLTICLNKINLVNHRNQIKNFNIYEKFPSLCEYFSNNYNRVYPDNYILIGNGMIVMSEQSTGTSFHDQILKLDNKVNLYDEYNNHLTYVKQHVTKTLFESKSNYSNIKDKLLWVAIKKTCATNVKAIILIYIILLLLLYLFDVSTFISFIILISCGICHYKHLDISYLEKESEHYNILLEAIQEKLYDIETEKCNIRVITAFRNKLEYKIGIYFGSNDLIDICTFDFVKGFSC